MESDHRRTYISANDSIILFSIAGCLTYILRGSISQAIISPMLTTNETKFKKDTCNYGKNFIDIQETDDFLRYKKKHNWDLHSEMLFSSSFYWGYFLTQLPAGYLSDYYGGKYFLLVGILGSSVCSFVAPTVVGINVENVNPVLVLRFADGLFQGFIYTSTSAILAQWSPLRVRTIMFCISFGSSALGVTLGAVLGYLFANTTKSWYWSFYFFGTFGMIFCGAWGIFGYSRPSKNPFIKFEEKVEIEEDLEQLIDNTHPKIIPWREFISSKPFWALVVVGIGFEWGWYTLIQHLSQYMNRVLKFHLVYGPFWSTLPFIFSWIFTLICGCLSDWLIYEKQANQSKVRKTFNVISMHGAAILLLCASIVQCNTTQLVLFTLAISIYAGNLAGSYINAIDLAPNFAGFLMGVHNLFGAFMGIMLPFIVEFIVPENTLSEWRTMFVVTFFVLVGTSVFYLIFGSSLEQGWNKLGQMTDRI